MTSIRNLKESGLPDFQGYLHHCEILTDLSISRVVLNNQDNSEVGHPCHKINMTGTTACGGSFNENYEPPTLQYYDYLALLVMMVPILHLIFEN